MKKASIVVLFLVLGLVIGYLLFGRFNGEFIPLEYFFQQQNALERFLSNAVLDFSNKKYSILASGVIGAVAGAVLAFSVFGKNKNQG